MKLRQKLAMVLASAMVVTAVPVVTMASTTTSMDPINVVVGSKLGYEKSGDTVTVTTADALQLFVKYDREYNDYSETFLVKAVDGKFDKAVYGEVGNAYDVWGDGELTLERLDDKTLKVTVADEYVYEQGFELPIFMEVTDKNPTIEIVGNGKVSTAKFVLGQEVTKEELAITFGKAKSISVDGEGTLGDIIITESVAGALSKEKGTKVTIELGRNSDLVFDLSVGDTVKLEGKDGLAGKVSTAEVTKVENDGTVIEVKIADTNISNLKGGVVIKDIPVAAEDRREEVALGDVDVDVTIEKEDDKKIEANGVVAVVAEYDVTLTIADDDKLELVAGKKAEKTKVTLKEAAAGSLNKNRDVYFELEGAEFTELVTKEIKKDGEVVANLEAVKDDKDNKDKITAIRMEFTDKLSTTKANELEFEFKAAAKAETNGAITLTAESRGFEKELEKEIGTAKSLVNVETTPFVIETGVKAQKGGSIVITETEKGNLEKGSEIVIDFKEAVEEGMKLKDAKVEAEGVEVSSKTSGSQIIINVDRASKEAGKITVSDIEVTVPGYVAEGGYDVTIAGDAIVTLAKDNIKLEDAVVVGEQHGAIEATIDLTTGAATLNGKAIELAAKPYVSAANRTMVGVRDLTTFLGLPGDAIEFANGIVTIFNGDEIVQIQNGSNVLNKNGVMVTMDEKVTIKDNRSYAPIRFIANALGMEVNVKDGKAVFTK